MTQLKNILAKKNIKQNTLAKLLKRDKTTINRWVTNSRDISWGNATDIAKAIKCNPIEIFNETKKAKIKLFCDAECSVEDKHFDEDHKEIEIPFEYSEKIVVYNNSFSIDRGFHIFDDNEISTTSIISNKMYLIYLVDEIYCGFINVDSSGSFCVFNSNGFKTEKLGNVSEIQYLYKKVAAKDE